MPLYISSFTIVAKYAVVSVITFRMYSRGYQYCAHEWWPYPDLTIVVFRKMEYSYQSLLRAHAESNARGR
jgi:hypothetical protein